MAQLAFWKQEKELTLEEIYSPRIEKKTNWRPIIYSVAGVVGLVNLLLALFLQFGVLELPAVQPLDFLVISLLSVIGPDGFF